jgi:formate/nitrite transporter FocA (FNT family)
MAMGVSAVKIQALNWISFITRNLLPVTLGNIIGGGFFVGMMYWLSFLYKGGRKPADAAPNDERPIQ